MKRSDTWKYSYICSSLRATLHLRDIVKSGRARGTREETQKRESGERNDLLSSAPCGSLRSPKQESLLATFAGSLDYEQSLSFFLVRQAERARDENDQGYYSERKRWPLSSAPLVSCVSRLCCLTLARVCTPPTKSELAVKSLTL